MRSSYLDYAMSVIVGRALPDVRDGLKPVHRRVLYAMHDIGLQPTRPYRKCAFIVGEVIGKYHPHGDSAIYDTLVRMAMNFLAALHARRRPGQLRLDRRRPAPPRCGTPRPASARLATELLRDIDADTVDFGPNYDESQQRAAGPAGALPEPAGQRRLRDRGRDGDQHPAAQPARGRSAPSTPTSTTPRSTSPGLMEHVKGPDFPGGGIMSLEGIRDAYASGRGIGPGPRPRPRRAAQGRQARRSSSPSCRSWSRRAATAA